MPTKVLGNLCTRFYPLYQTFFHGFSFIIILFILNKQANAQSNNIDKYQIHIDLKNVSDDNKVKISVIPPKITEKFATYVIPTSAYGGYSKAPLTKLLENFTAYDIKGKSLPFKYITDSEIVIYHAHRLTKIEYWVRDAKSIKNQEFYQAGAPNIQANENFIINHNGFYGYFYNYLHLPFELTILKPKHLYGASALQAVSQNDSIDIFWTDQYFALFEHPVMYAEADTLSYWQGQTRIQIAVYSETSEVTARSLYPILKPLTTALQLFMQHIPVNNYHFIMYFAKREEKITNLSQYGGLMCGASSFYVLPEIKDANKRKKMVQSVAAHEFLHLLSPYSLYSKESKYAGFATKTMSKHLWLYEGVTEYFSLLVLVQNNLITEEQFFEEMAQKMALANAYPPISLTRMSERIFKRKHQEMYHNLYYKGALVAFLLDIELHDLTEGVMSLPKLILQLIARYGPNQPFDDGELIAEMVEMTHPQLKFFFKKYVMGKETPPYNQFFAKIGQQYFSRLEEKVVSYGQFSLWPDYETGRLIFHQVKSNMLGMKNGDVLQQINGQAVRIGNFTKTGQPLYYPKEDDKIVIRVIKQNNDQIMTLHAQPRIFTQTRKHVFRQLFKPNKKALALKNKLFKR